MSLSQIAASASVGWFARIASKSGASASMLDSSPQGLAPNNKSGIYGVLGLPAI